MAPDPGSEPTSEADDPFCASDEELRGLASGWTFRRFVVVGDSAAEGVGDELPGYRSASWPERVAEVLRSAQPDLQWLNLGKRNLRSGEVREQQLGPALEFSPDLAAVVCGGNDAFANDFDPAAVEDNVEAIIGSLVDAGATVVTYALMDISRVWDGLTSFRPAMKQLNDIVRSVASRRGAVVVDMWDHPASSKRNVFSEDLIHTSMRGHAILATETLRELHKALAGDGDDT